MKNTAARVGPAGVQGAAERPRKRRRALAPEHDATPFLIALKRWLCGAPPLEREMALMQRRGPRDGHPVERPPQPDRLWALVALGEPDGGDVAGERRGAARPQNGRGTKRK